MQLAWKVEAGSNVKLQDYDPGYVDEHTDPALARAELQQLGAELGELQELLAAAHYHSLLIVLQGMDASGKAGSIHEVMTHINPQGCQVRSFKVPTLRELDHDFLWRVHKAAPRYGNIGVFNRSHYEEALIVRVMKFQPEEVWRPRYEQINAFEKLLTDNGYLLLKFFLHISKKEQAERFKARLNDPTKNWKFSPFDLEMRKHWSDFQDASFAGELFQIPVNGPQRNARHLVREHERRGGAILARVIIH